MVGIIACISKNRVIGKDGDLVFKISDDLKRFKKLTTNSVIVMGRKTWESIGSKPLPNRINVVVTRSIIDGVTCIDDPDVVLSLFPDKDIWIIGGQKIFEHFITSCDRLEITEVDKVVDGDTYFPEIPEIFKLVEEIEINKELNYKFKTYDRLF